MRLAASLVALSLLSSSFDAEARPRFRGFSAGAKTPAPAPTPDAATSFRASRTGGFIVAPALVGASRPARATPSDVPTGSLGAAPVPVAAPAPAKPRDPCAAGKLFGQGAGFCVVN